MGISRILRIAKTGMCFSLFGLGGLLFALVIFPLTYVVVRRYRRRKVFRQIVALLFQNFIHLMKSCRLITYELKGLERISPGALVLANHPSLIDVVFLLGWLEGANCVVKAPLFRNPFTVGPVTAAGYINNSARGFTEQVCEALADGDTVVMFPEGTRTSPLRPMHFHRGAAHCAIQSQAPIYPITIEVYPPTLSKQEAWWQVPEHTPHFRLTAHQQWPSVSPALEGTPGQQARRLNSSLLEFFEASLKRAPGAS